MAEPEPTSPSGGSGAGVPTSQFGVGSHDQTVGAQPSINVQQLADRVYSLLLADARLGWARGEAPLRPTRKPDA